MPIPRNHPTVALYIRIPVELRVAIDAAAHIDPEQPWKTHRLQDLVCEALYAQFLPDRLEAFKANTRAPIPRPRIAPPTTKPPSAPVVATPGGKLKAAPSKAQPSKGNTPARRSRRAS
jgi:hypothetical protein